MREGFTNALSNSRGGFFFNGGKNTMKLAKENRKKAEQLEEEGYFRFAAAMRDFAKNYEKQAEWEAGRETYHEMFNTFI